MHQITSWSWLVTDGTPSFTALSLAVIFLIHAAMLSALSGIGRGSAQAVRQMRELLWPDGPPEWAKELATAEGSAGSSTVSLESMSGALSDTLLAHASSPAAVSESET